MPFPRKTPAYYPGYYDAGIRRCGGVKKLRAMPETQKIPVIMATAKGMEYDKIQSLDLGADDYLVKPFGVMELVSRVKAVLRRCEDTVPAQTLSLSGISMQVDNRVVTVDGETVALTYKEFELLHLFLSHIGVVFPVKNC